MIGQTISHYEIVEKIGEGGMGVVYKAKDTKLDRFVALKFLAPHLLKDEDAHRRFVREAKAAAALDHPNICTVYEIDEADGKTFIAMAFIEGQSLDKVIASGPMKIEDAVEIAGQTARALAVAHEKGVVHRDIKPANILIPESGSGRDRQAKLMDFGLAQLCRQLEDHPGAIDARHGGLHVARASRRHRGRRPRRRVGTRRGAVRNAQRANAFSGALRSSDSLFDLERGARASYPGFPFWPWYRDSIHPRRPEYHVFSR